MKRRGGRSMDEASLHYFPLGTDASSTAGGAMAAPRLSSPVTVISPPGPGRRGPPVPRNAVLLYLSRPPRPDPIYHVEDRL